MCYWVIINGTTTACDIVAVGCAGHGNGLYLLDRSGRPLVGVPSLDSRAVDLATELRQNSGARIHALCLQQPWPAQTPVLLAWFKQNRPDIYQQAGRVLLCKDYIGHCLTGEHVSEISDMSACGLLRMPDCSYDDELLALYGISDARDLLPRLIDPCDIAGVVTSQAAAVTGLAAGTPVIGGYFDAASSAMGSGVVRSGEASIIAGSWSVNQVFSDAPVEDPSVFLVSAFAPNRFVNMEASATSAANLEWYVREFIERGQPHKDPFGYCNDQIAAITPRADDPFFHPFLYGSGQGADYRAGFYGLAGWHGEGNLLRAIYEGVMFEHRRHIDVLRNAGVSFDRAVLSGGGSRSPIWPQMFADGLGVPIAVAEGQETGALGAAIGAAIATGHVSDYEDGVARMTRVKQVFEPRTAPAAMFQKRFETYLSLTETMRSFWSKMNDAKNTK